MLFLALTGCANPGGETASDPGDISVERLFESFSAFKMRINPVEATKIGDNQYNDYVANYVSEPYRKKLIESYSNYLDAIGKLNVDELTESQQLSVQVMKWDCEVKLEGLTNNLVTIASPIYDIPHFQLMPISQTSTFHLYFNELGSGSSVQPFHTVQDYDNWLSRVDDYIEWIQTSMDNMRQGVDLGVVWPKPIIEKMIGPIQSLIVEPATDHLFYRPVKSMPEDFSLEDRTRLEVAYRKMISDKINPIHQELLIFLTDVYLPAGTNYSGIRDLPNGKETYQYLIKYHTTTNMTPDEIFELGKREVDRISGEMETLKEEIGFSGNLRSFFDHIRSSPQQMPFTTPNQVIENFDAIHETMKPRLERLFDLKPKAGFRVERIAAFKEASSAAHYVPGTKDASRPGVFYVGIPDAQNYNKYADEALFLHEAVPGHHYQLSLQQENKNLPAFLHPESISVFVEGWALYAESLGSELGLYSDLYQKFGMLSMEMHRAIRLVVDSGMHAKGWTREQAIQYSLDNEAESEASIISEIERYMATPAQALSYKLGQLKIRELRTRAEVSLGEAFDIREYHNQVLNSGSLPLVLLEDKISRWIKREQKKKSI